MDHLDALKNSNHPWSQFLYARSEVILWMKKEMHRSDEEIARCLSMDEMQVTLIRMRREELTVSKK